MTKVPRLPLPITPSAIWSAAGARRRAMAPAPAIRKVLRLRSIFLPELWHPQGNCAAREVAVLPMVYEFGSNSPLPARLAGSRRSPDDPPASGPGKAEDRDFFQTPAVPDRRSPGQGRRRAGL